MEEEMEQARKLMKLIEDEEIPHENDVVAAYDAHTHGPGSVASIASQSLPSVDVDDAATDNYENEAKKNGTTVSHRLADDVSDSHDEKTLQESNHVEHHVGVIATTLSATATSVAAAAATTTTTTTTTATAATATVHSQTAAQQRQSSALRNNTGLPGAFAVDRSLRHTTSAWSSDQTFANDNNHNNHNSHEAALVSAHLVEDPQRVYGVPVVATSGNHQGDHGNIAALCCDKIKFMVHKYPWSSISTMTIALILVIVLAVLLLLPKSQLYMGNNTNDSKGTTPALPSIIPTLQPSSSNIITIKDTHKLFMTELNLSETCLSTSLQQQQQQQQSLVTSPQSKALDWILADPHLQSYPLYRKQQRFVVSLLYFAMENVTQHYPTDDGTYTNDIKTIFQLSYNQSECDFFRDAIRCNHSDTYDDDGQDIIETICLDGQEKALSTVLPCQLSLLSHLQVLHLYRVDVHGSIPSQLGLLKDLRVLNVGFNDLSGTLPSQVYALTHLERLIFSGNTYLRGTLSTQVGQLANLFILDCRATSLSGSIPTQIGNLHASLAFLDVENARMKGRLPTQLGRLTKLVGLWLGENDFRGSLPWQLSDLVHLEVFVLHHTQLTGTLPTQLGLMKSLLRAEWYHNQFHGSIPTEFGQLESLMSLLVYYNQLSGSLPTQAFLHMTSLNHVDVSGNSLNGTVPIELTYLRDLASLSLEFNYFHGTIPQQLCHELFLFRFDCHLEQPTTPAFAANSNDDSSTSSFLCGCDCSCDPAVQEQQPFEGCSRRNQQELEIRITTDDFGYQTSWVLLEMESGMLIDSVDHSELRDNRLYTTHLCLNAGSTYQFIIRDLEDNGICCSVGFGDYSLLLEGVQFAVGYTFLSEDMVQFDVVAPTSPTTSPVPTLTPTTTMHPTEVHISQPSPTKISSQMPSQLDCNTQDEVVFELAIFTDFFPEDTRWELRNASIPVDVYHDTDIIYSVNYLSYVLNQTRYIERRCLDRGGSYTFVLYDAWGDGLTDGIGSYSLTVDTVEIASGSPYGFKEIVDFDVD